MKREEQEKKERELRELQELVKKETDETIEAWRKKNEDMKSQCEEASQECERLQKEVETCKIDKEKEIEDRMTDAKKKKKDRRNAEERIEVIKKELIQATEDESRLTEEQKAAEGKYMDEEGADTKVWEQLEIKWNQEDERNKQAEQYVDKALVFLKYLSISLSLSLSLSLYFSSSPPPPHPHHALMGTTR